MPTRPPHPCRHPGCRELTRKAYCPKHEEGHAKDHGWKDKGSASSRGYGADWRRIRRVVLNRDPFCKGCGRRPSEHADHIRPKSQGGTNDLANLQGLCGPCHRAKTAREDRRPGPKPPPFRMPAGFNPPY